VVGSQLLNSDVTYGYYGVDGQIDGVGSPITPRPPRNSRLLLTRTRTGRNSEGPSPFTVHAIRHGPESRCVSGRRPPGGGGFFMPLQPSPRRNSFPFYPFPSFSLIGSTWIVASIFISSRMAFSIL
jgi:hypothetical protein